MNLKFGTDLDGCLFRTDLILIDKINKLLNLNIEYEDINNERMLDAFIEDKFLKDFKDIVVETVTCDQLPIEYDVKPVLQILEKELGNIYFITSRHKTSIGATLCQLEELNLKDYIVYLSGVDERGYNKEKKSKYINELGINIFVDDDYRHIYDLRDNTNCQILIYDRPWNRMIKEEDRVQRVYNWNEILFRVLSISRRTL